MVEYAAHSLDLTFMALADQTRRKILARLAMGEATVSELAAPFKISLAAVSKHLKVLERAGLLKRNVDGRVHRCNLDTLPMVAANEWIEEYRVFWEGSLDSLGDYLNEMQKKENEK